MRPRPAASVRPVGGCTALMLMMKAGVFHPTRLVSLRKIAGLSGIKAAADGGLVIGATTPLAAPPAPTRRWRSRHPRHAARTGKSTASGL